MLGSTDPGWTAGRSSASTVTRKPAVLWETPADACASGASWVGPSCAANVIPSSLCLTLAPTKKATTNSGCGGKRYDAADEGESSSAVSALTVHGAAPVAPLPPLAPRRPRARHRGSDHVDGSERRSASQFVSCVSVVWPPQVAEQRGELRVGAVRSRLDRPDGDSQLRGDLGMAASVQVLQTHDSCLVRRQGLDRLAHLPRPRPATRGPVAR